LPELQIPEHFFWRKRGKHERDRKKQRLRNAGYVDKLHKQFKITHQFHPEYGKTYELIDYRNSWNRKTVNYFDEHGICRSISLEWTDAAGIDPFIEFSKGCSVFHVNDLLRLCDLVKDISEEKK